jgi:hypothetical protein
MFAWISAQVAQVKLLARARPRACRSVARSKVSSTARAMSSASQGLNNTPTLPTTSGSEPASDAATGSRWTSPPRWVDRSLDASGDGRQFRRRRTSEDEFKLRFSLAEQLERLEKDGVILVCPGPAGASRSLVRARGPDGFRGFHPGLAPPGPTRSRRRIQSAWTPSRQVSFLPASRERAV